MTDLERDLLTHCGTEDCRSERRVSELCKET